MAKELLLVDSAGIGDASIQADLPELRNHFNAASTAPRYEKYIFGNLCNIFQAFRYPRYVKPTLYPEPIAGREFSESTTAHNGKRQRIVKFHVTLPTQDAAAKLACLYTSDHQRGEKLVSLRKESSPCGGITLTLFKRLPDGYEHVARFEDILAQRSRLLNGRIDGWALSKN